MYDPKATISSVEVPILNVLKEYISSKGKIHIVYRVQIIILFLN